MTTIPELIERVDVENILQMPRFAGGHDEQMKGLIKNSKVIAHYNKNDYSGVVATILQLNDTKEFVVYSDYYGSCNGCDAWEDCSNSEAISMSKHIASEAKIFSNKKELIQYLLKKDRSWEDWKTPLLKEFKQSVEGGEE